MKIKSTFLENVNELIDNHLASPQLKTLLEDYFDLSASQIYRKIKQKTGVATSIYIRQKRLEQAHHIIENSDIPLSEIASMVGFHQLAYFSTCFKEYYGYPPSNLNRKD